MTAIREAHRGPDHPDTAHSLTNCGRALAAQGDLDQAVSLLERAVTIRTSSLGPNHPRTLSSVSYLAEVRRLGE